MPITGWNPWKLFKSAFGLAMIALASFCASVSHAATVNYTTFNGESLALTSWEGSNIVLLTESAGLDANVMNKIVDKLDAAWGVYHDLTGKAPIPLPQFTVNGKPTIAEVANTCGAGCAFLGYTGIEIMPNFFDMLYFGVRDNNQYDQTLFFELGRNFWHYKDQLEAAPSFTSGFAIANRFVSMEQAGAPGAPFSYLGTTYSFEEFKKLNVVDLLAAYQANDALNWANTIAIGQGVPSEPFGTVEGLTASMYYGLYQDHGYTGYQAFYQALNKLPAATTSEAAASNFLRAAYLGTGQNYIQDFKAHSVVSTVPLPGAMGAMLLATLVLGGVSRLKSRKTAA